jgi:hypothetical protein
LKLHGILGRNTHQHDNNLFFNANGDLVYPSGNNIILVREGEQT